MTLPPWAWVPPGERAGVGGLSCSVLLPRGWAPAILSIEALICPSDAWSQEMSWRKNCACTRVRAHTHTHSHTHLPDLPCGSEKRPQNVTPEGADPLLVLRSWLMPWPAWCWISLGT